MKGEGGTIDERGGGVVDEKRARAKGVGGAWEGVRPALGPFWKGPKAPQPLHHGLCAASLRARFSRTAFTHCLDHAPCGPTLRARLGDGIRAGLESGAD